ncbi:MAG: hypothetical protein ACREDS_16085 [Limisphaerales bacterium]
MVGGTTISNSFKIRLERPNLYRVEWSQAIDHFTNGGVVWSAGGGNFLLMKMTGQQNAKPSEEKDMETALSAATGISGQASSIIPGTFFNQNWGNVLKINPTKFALQRLKDEKVDDIDCFVLSTVIDPANLPNKGQIPDNRGRVGKITTMLWIGKQDYLMHQTQTIMEGASIALPQMSDAKIKEVLENQNKPATLEAIAAYKKQVQDGMKKALAMLNTGKISFKQTHENISVNQKFSPADFAP